MVASTVILFSFYGRVTLRVSAPPSTIRFLHSEWRQFEIDATDEKPDIDAVFASALRPRSLSATSANGKKLGGWYKGCFWRTTLKENGGRLTVHYQSLPHSNFLFKDSCLEPLVLTQLR